MNAETANLLGRWETKMEFKVNRLNSEMQQPQTGMKTYWNPSIHRSFSLRGVF